MSVTVATNMRQAVDESIANGLLTGSIPIPVPVNEVVRSAFTARLQQLGFGVCEAEPCGDGAMRIEMLESSVNSQMTERGIEARVHLKARVHVRQPDGQEPFDWTFWDTRTGGVAGAPVLIRACADQLAARMAATLEPRTASASLPLVDGGPLSGGVNLLLSSNWNGAVDYFGKLTQEQPDLDGAWYDLGVAYEAAGDWRQALGAYERAAALKRSRTYLDAVDTARRMAPPAPTPSNPPAPQ